MELLKDAGIEAVRQKLSDRRNLTLSDLRLSPAAVLLLLYRKSGDYALLLHRRTEFVEHHKGEVCFPGGSREPEDESLWKTALRETWEEMGIRPADVIYLGELDEVTTRTGYRVHPFVGTIPWPYPFHGDPAEVAEVLEVPVRELANPDNWREEVHWLDGKPTKLYAYAYGSSLIYGATARIIRQFLQQAGDVLVGGDQVARG